MGCRGGSIVDLIVQDEVDCKLLVTTSHRQSALNKRFIESKRANCRHGKCRRQFALQVSGDHVVCAASLTTGLPVFDLENRDCFSEEDECHCRRSTRERVLDEHTVTPRCSNSRGRRRHHAGERLYIYRESACGCRGGVPLRHSVFACTGWAPPIFYIYGGPTCRKSHGRPYDTRYLQPSGYGPSLLVRTKDKTSLLKISTENKERENKQQ